MKRLLFAVLTAFAVLPAMSQQVFGEIRQKAQQIVDNPSTPATTRQINQFKVDALNYLVMKMKQEMPDSSALILDKQAFGLHQFLNLYAHTMLSVRQLPQKIQVERMRVFIDASINAPFFRDRDDELVLAYFRDENCITRFSLDTDWQQAYVLAAKT